MNNLTIADVDEIGDEVLAYVNISNQLTKAYKDLDNVYFDWQVVQENIFETQLFIEFEKIKKESLKNLELLNLPEVRSDVKKFCNFLQTIEYNEKTSIIKAGWYQFEWNRFPIKIDVFFEKAKNPTNRIINIISKVSSDPFDDLFFTNMNRAYQVGGQSVLNIFDIPANFQLLDENALKFLKELIR